ncbi:MAG: choice-of-anchor J domain-containing protein, partial [Vicingaceae bacterium]
MKSLIIFLVILVVGVDCLKAQSVIFFDDFGSASFPNGYSIYDVDSNTVNSTVSDIFDEAWVQLSFYEDDNAFIGSTSWYDPTGTSNDWLVSPPINLTTENYLVFKTISVDSTVHDGYELKLSTTTNEVDSFKTTLMEVNSENSFWTTHVVDLSDYATDTIYLAWINNTNNGYVLGLDDVKVVEVNAFDVAIEKVLLEDKVEQNSEINVVIRNKG